MKPRQQFNAGDRLGDYEILRYLRAGGMATLFLARRHGAAGVSRPVVIKMIHPHLAEDENIVNMFIDEARISSHISHSNVVYVENFGVKDGVYFMAMEYVQGCSLDAVLKTLHQRSRMTPVAIAVHIAREAAAGLHAAHETTDEYGKPLNIVHRDISPSNVLITHDGRIKVIDFGIAKAHGRIAATRTGGDSLKGKLRYMAPEQAWGREIDRRADIYSLGVTLWELLTCQPLFRGGDDLSLLDTVRNPTVPSPREFNPEVSPALEAVLQRAMSVDPATRTPTALEFREQLAHAMPESTSVSESAIGQLVTLVRDTLGPAAGDPDENATTPISAVPRDLGMSSPPTTGSAAGQITVTYRTRQTKRWVIGGIAIASVAAALVLFATRGDRDASPGGAPAAAGSQPPALDPGAVPHRMPETAVVARDAGIEQALVAHDAGVAAATPVATGKKPAATKRPAIKRKQPASGEVNVDGTVLAR